MAAIHEIKVHTEDLDEVTEFIERNRERLREAPQFCGHLSQVLASPRAYIFFQDAEGFHLEPGMPLLQAIAAMRRGGCR